MTWKEELRRVTMPDGRRLIGASFRGVPFFVESADRTGGRRTVVHVFPLRDDQFVEDMGRRERTFPIEGYVIGDDYLQRRDALLAALEDVAGPGELVHPSYGTLRAICARFTVKETTRDGGMARISIEFEPTPLQPPTPVETPDLPQQVATSASAAVEATEAELEEEYDVAGLPAFALESAQDALTRAADGLGAALAPIVSATQELAALTGRVALLTAQAASLVRQPAGVLGAFHEVITGLGDTVESAPGAVMDALLDAYSVDLGPPIIATTATRQRELANQAALVGALRRVMAIEAARLAPLVPYVSIEEATTARERVAAMLEEQAATAGDTAYPAIVNLRSEVMRAVPGGAAFARVVTVTRRVATPSLLLSYQLYGSVKQERDIIARNQISHPGFVAGELKVLSE